MLFQISRSSPISIQEQLLDALRQAIMDGELQPHDQLPGELQLVEQLGVSRVTVQRAWQAAEGEGLIYKVMGKGTFVAEPRPAAVTATVGFLIPEFRGTFHSYLLAGAENVMREAGYRLHFAQTGRDIDAENQLLREMCEDEHAGVLLWPAMGDLEGRFLVDPDCALPIVLMDRPLPGSGLPCVASRNYAGALEAMHHLLALGHQQIAFVSRPHLTLWPVAERLRAYQDAMRNAGLQPAPPLLVGPGDEMSTYHAETQAYTEDIAFLAQRLRQPDRPTAIFAMNDLMALQVLAAANQANLRVPDDLSLVGFDNLDMMAHVDPPLTTVEQTPGRIGVAAASLLLLLMTGQRLATDLSLLPTRLIVRRSTTSLLGR